MLDLHNTVAYFAAFLKVTIFTSIDAIDNLITLYCRNLEPWQTSWLLSPPMERHHM
jgi:hypothetical protein